jgi:pyruvate-formate lyase
MNPLQNNPDSRNLMEAGEFFAAGFFELPDATPMERWSRAYRRHWEHRPLPDYEGSALWCWLKQPPKKAIPLVRPGYSFTWDYASHRLEETLARLPTHAGSDFRLMDAWLKEENDRRWKMHSVHTCGGCNYTHSIPHYGRVMAEGFDAYRGRILALRDEAAAAKRSEKVIFFDSLLDVLAGLRVFHDRLIAHLKAFPVLGTEQARNQDRLLAAYGQIPFAPARTFFEALACQSYIWMLDGGDNPGRLDVVLQPFYERDTAVGLMAHADAVTLVHEFYGHVSDLYGWSTALGGRDAKGKPAYNDMTKVCLEASHGCIRPSLELRVTDEMPADVWDAALDALASGCGQPALYHEDAYLASLRAMHLGLRDEDLVMWNGGGCTETMIQGCSNVGSLEAGLHLPLVFEHVMKKELPQAFSFEAFRNALRLELAEVIRDVARQVSIQQAAAAEVRPQPMRSLLIDDCIDRGVEFNAGGARYNWSVVNVAGLSNVADSLAALREVVFEKREKTGAELLAILEADFAGHEDFRRRLERCPRFGNDNPEADDLAAGLARDVFEELRLYAPWRGGKFMPSCIMFETYGHLGRQIGATPDGRRAGGALADSIGPVQGRDAKGPTAMLKSVTKLPLSLAPGTPVLNLRLNPSLLKQPAERDKAKALIQTYFRMGGLQLQITALDAKQLREAMADPASHPNLIVRIGGYSTWFRNLSPDLQREVIARTEYGL